MSLIVNTFAFEPPISSRSAASSERTPTSATRSSDGVGQASLANASPATPSAAASGIPCTLPLGEVSGVLRSPCASIHSAPPGAVHLRHAAERADRDRVVAAEHERHGAAAARLLDERGHALARAHDRLEVARPRIADLGRLRQAHVDVAPVDALAAEARDPLLQAGVPDRATGPCRRRAGRRRGRARRRSRPPGGLVRAAHRHAG